MSLVESPVSLDELLVSLVELPVSLVESLVSLDGLPAGRGESLVRLGVLLAQVAVIGGAFLVNLRRGRRTEQAGLGRLERN